MKHHPKTLCLEEHTSGYTVKAYWNNYDHEGRHEAVMCFTDFHALMDWLGDWPVMDLPESAKGT